MMMATLMVVFRNSTCYSSSSDNDSNERNCNMKLEIPGLVGENAARFTITGLGLGFGIIGCKVYSPL